MDRCSDRCSDPHLGVNENHTSDQWHPWLNAQGGPYAPRMCPAGHLVFTTPLNTLDVCSSILPGHSGQMMRAEELGRWLLGRVTKGPLRGSLSDRPPTAGARSQRPPSPPTPPLTPGCLVLCNSGLTNPFFMFQSPLLPFLWPGKWLFRCLVNYRRCLILWSTENSNVRRSVAIPQGRSHMHVAHIGPSIMCTICKKRSHKHIWVKHIILFSNSAFD